MAFLKNKKYLTHAILINSHLCGVIGMLSPYKDLFILLTPFNLILSTVIVFYHHHDFNKQFWLFAITIFLAGYFLEVAGVQTGVIFGEYEYGSSLGLKMLGVPLVMGLNWLVLIYSVGVVFEKLKINSIVKSILGASVLTFLDFFIEPIAIKYDYWTWQATEVPTQNYIAWFIASFLFLLFFYILKFNKNNKIALLLCITQLLFFVFLNLF